MSKRLLLCLTMSALAGNPGLAGAQDEGDALPQAWWGSVGPVKESTYQRPELPGYGGRYNPWYGVSPPSEEEYLNTLGVEPWHSPGKPETQRPAYPRDDGSTYEGHYDPYRFGYYAPRPRTGFEPLAPPYGAGGGQQFPYPAAGAPYGQPRSQGWGW